MYVPRRFQEPDQDTVRHFIQSNPFGALVSHDGTRPIATHLLFELQAGDGDVLVLNGHMARANPQWRSLDPARDALAIFSGPHTYISPRWYEHANVPTWNYMVVHVYGSPRLITDPDELRAMLARLVDAQEADSGATPTYRLESLPEDMLGQMMQAIVGFQIKVTGMEASFKLSQNRSEPDFANIIAELHKRDDEDSHAIAQAMEQRQATLYD